MLLIKDLSLRVAGRLLIENASVQLPTGSRVGLVGRNGTGKTTLFRAIMGELAAETGGIEIPSRTRIGRLSQEAPDGLESLIEVVLAADTERAQLLAAADTEHDPHRIAEIHTRLVDIDAHSAPARAASILAGLGFNAQAQQRPVGEFSGGWRMRVALASVLFAEPDLMLLDEPTNYLDLEGTLWLEDHLARYPKSFIVISHDRDLLDNSVDHILHLNGSKLTLYRGGYTSFARQRAERQVLDAKAVKKQEAQRKHLQAFVDRFKAKASKAKQAQSRVKLLAKLVPINAMVDDDVRPITIPAPEKLLSPPIIAMDEVSAGYTPERTVLRDLTLRIDNDDRIALLGSNGNGKSTLAKLLAGRLTPTGGSITRANKLNVGYFAQHQLDELRMNDSAYDHVRDLMPNAAEAQVRARAGAIGFSADKADTPVAKLSGGEKARLLLGLATFRGPQLVILDEPTNHLDIDSRAALIEAINDYPGAVILVSHDRYLIEACVERLWLVENGSVAPFDGDLDEYRKLVLGGPSRSNGGAKQPRSSRSEQRRDAAGKRAALAPLQQKITAAEKTIAHAKSEIGRLDAALAAPGLFARDPQQATKLSKARADAASALAKAEEDWLEASTAHEAAKAEA
ncbi:MAG: ATP-binding cassette, subfamily er 3 [Alphaproteobacteria bacterium]|jgi:ATP-binding cassette subfamily F protein 3|nr:ATP-binding cassette, subfamily er 3 [Alphaproteobacteria bacterium]